MEGEEEGPAEDEQGGEEGNADGRIEAGGDYQGSQNADVGLYRISEKRSRSINLAFEWIV